MINYRQKDIWLADFGDPIGHEQGYTRPFIIVSSNPLNNSFAKKLIVIPITSKNRKINTHIKIPRQFGLTQESFALVEDIRSISINRLIKYIGTIDNIILQQIHKTLKYLLDLEI